MCTSTQHRANSLNRPLKRPAPVSRSSFLARTTMEETETTAKRKSQVAAEEPAKKKRAGWNKQNEMLPDALNALEPKDIIQLISEEIVLERDCEPFTMGKQYYKAVSIEIPHSGDGAGEKQTFDFANLNIRQLRKVAASLGVRNSSRMVKDTILIKI